jgi:hypothetical protein
MSKPTKTWPRRSGGEGVGAMIASYIMHVDASSMADIVDEGASYGLATSGLVYRCVWINPHAR